MGRSADKSLRVNDYSQGRIDILERFTGKCGGVDEWGGRARQTYRQM